MALRLPIGELVMRCHTGLEVYVPESDYDALLAERDRLRAQADCAPYLREGETPLECIERHRKETMSVLSLLVKEKRRTDQYRDLLQRCRRFVHHHAYPKVNSQAGLPPSGAEGVARDILDEIDMSAKVELIAAEPDTTPNEVYEARFREKRAAESRSGVDP